MTGVAHNGLNEGAALADWIAYGACTEPTGTEAPAYGSNGVGAAGVLGVSTGGGTAISNGITATLPLGRARSSKDRAKNGEPNSMNTPTITRSPCLIGSSPDKIRNPTKATAIIAKLLPMLPSNKESIQTTAPFMAPPSV